MQPGMGVVGLTDEGVALKQHFRFYEIVVHFQVEVHQNLKFTGGSAYTRNSAPTRFIDIPFDRVLSAWRRQMLSLVVPGMEHLPGYLDARRRGWAAYPAMRQEAPVADIEQAPWAFLDGLREMARPGQWTSLSSGERVPRLPCLCWWLWDGQFCGAIRFRWQPGCAELPPYCNGHIGYSVVPWKRQRGYAREALALMLQEARARGLPYVELTPYETNLASRRVIESNGGVLRGTYQAQTAQGPVAGLRYRIAL